MNTTRGNFKSTNIFEKHNINQSFRIIYNTIYELLCEKEISKYTYYKIMIKMSEINKLGINNLTEKNLQLYSILNECLTTNIILIDENEIEQLECYNIIIKKREYLSLLSKIVGLRTKKTIGLDVDPKYNVSKGDKIMLRVKHIGIK